MSENGQENHIKSETIETLLQVADALNLTPDYIRKKIVWEPQWGAPMYKRVHQQRTGAGITKSTNADYFFSAGTIELYKDKFSKGARKLEMKTVHEENEKLKEKIKSLEGQFAIMKKTILDGGYWPPAAQSLTDLKIEEEE